MQINLFRSEMNKHRVTNDRYAHFNSYFHLQCLKNKYKCNSSKLRAVEQTRKRISISSKQNPLNYQVNY